MTYKEEIRREVALKLAQKNSSFGTHPDEIVKDAEIFYEFLKGDDDDTEELEEYA